MVGDFFAAYYILTTSPFLSTDNCQAQRTSYFDKSNYRPKQVGTTVFGCIPGNYAWNEPFVRTEAIAISIDLYLTTVSYGYIIAMNALHRR